MTKDEFIDELHALGFIWFNSVTMELKQTQVKTKLQLPCIRLNWVGLLKDPDKPVYWWFFINQTSINRKLNLTGKHYSFEEAIQLVKKHAFVK